MVKFPFEFIILSPHSQSIRKPRICWEIRPKSDQHRELVNIEIRGSGFSAKSSDFLPPKWSKNAGFEDVYRRNVAIFAKTSWKTKNFRENLLIFASFLLFAKMEKPFSFQPYLRWMKICLKKKNLCFSIELFFLRRTEAGFLVWIGYVPVLK
jgi:hypothetical protein